MRRNPVITVALATISFLLGDSLFANTLVSNNANVEVQGAWKGVAEDLSWEIVRYPDGFFFERKIVAYDFAKPAIAFFAWGNWFIRGNAYSLSYSGSTATETPATPKGTLEFRIVSVSAQTFLYSGREGPPFEETKLPHLPKNVLSLRVERTAMWKDKIMRFDQREKVPGLVLDRLRRGL
jgi:hypothetical protein